MKNIYLSILLLFSIFISAPVFSSTTTITATGLSFVPTPITIVSGDTVNFSIGGSHNVVEVSFSTWSVNGNTPLVGGFNLPFGGGILTSATGLSVGTHYYVCSPHASSGMKGIINVGAAGPSPYLFSTVGVAVCENFDGFTAAGFSPSPIAGQLNSNSWALTGFSDGILAFGGTRTTASTDYTRGTTTWGGASTGGLYSILGNSNIMIQGTASDMTNGTVTMRIQNTSGSALNNFDVNYDIFSKNDQNRSTAVKFLYSNDDITYYRVPSLNYATVADSNGVLDSVNRTTTLTGFNVALGGYLYVRWNIIDNGGSGSRDEIGIDNVCIIPNTTGTTVPALLGSLVINEFVNNNLTSSVINPSGYRADYIELYNLTSSALDIGGCSVGNSTTNSFGYTFPLATTIPASGYVIVWCDTENLAPGFHSRFTLNNVTGGVSLSNGLGRYLDSVAYTGGIADTSFSRIPNGTGAFRNRALLTPAAVNDTFVPIIIPVLTFHRVSSSVVESGGAILVQVDISNPSADTTKVDVEVNLASTATSSDYTFTPTTLSFLPSSRDSQLISIPILNDATPEPNENIILNLKNATNHAIYRDSVHTITILDDDVLRVNWDTTAMSYDENAGTISANVLISAASAFATSVDVSLIAGSATGGVDFTFTPITLTFPASTTTPQIVNFTITDDLIYESLENFTLKISNPTNSAIIDDSLFTISIVDNDALPTGDCSNLFFSEYIEGSSNNKSIEIYNPTNFPINLTGYTLVKYLNGSPTPSGTRVLSGTIASGDVYVVSNNNANASIILASDDTTGFMNFNGDDALSLNYLTDTLDIIGIIGVDPGASWAVGTGSTFDHTLVRTAYTYKGNKDWAAAGSEWTSFPVDMTDSLGAHHIMPCGTPVPPTPPTISVTPVSRTVSEGAVTTTFDFNVVNPSSTSFSVDVIADVIASTATLSSDYTYIDTTVTFPAGGVQSVSILEDLLVEGSETIKIRLRNPTAGAIVIDSVITITIRDNDSLLIYMQGAGSSVVENISSTSFNVKMNGVSANPTKVDVKYLSGDATRNTDFIYRDTTITFAPGDTMKTLAVSVIEDMIDELNEQVIINLSNPTNGAKLGVKNYTLVIIDNDSTVNGIDNITFMNGVHIFPNPVLQKLVIETTTAIDELFITDLNGRVLHTLKDIEAGTKQEIDFSLYANGMYILRATRGNDTFVKNILKQ